MPIVKVPLTNPVYKNIDGSQMNDENFILINGFSDEKGATNTFPGYQILSDVFSGAGVNRSVTGLFYWNNMQFLLAVIDGALYRFDYTAGVFTLTGDREADVANPLANRENPVTFTTDATYVFYANGGRIMYSNGTADAAYIADGDAPTTVTHVAWLDGYVLANNGDNKIYYSDVNSSLSWNALNFFSAAGNADYITAMIVWNREIYMFGPSSIEVWENDGVTPFSRIQGGYIESGTIAPYSIVSTDKGFFFLGQDRRFVEFNGRVINQLNTAYDDVIEGLATVSDCRAFKIKISGRQLVVFQFPTANRSFCYDYIKEEWSEIGEYAGLGEQYDLWDVGAYAYAPHWGLHLAGSFGNSYIRELDKDIATNDGVDIRTRRVSGHINYGTNELKQCNAMTLRLKRGYVEDSSEPTMTLRWNDDGQGWSNEIPISLGGTGDVEIIQKIYPIGIYKTRQYEVVFSGSITFVMGDVEEDIEVLGQ